ncbi:uncharacterized protein LOC143898425 [Temnothorax americanus]|uniref:uncharacterized protein LOC143898425 n=1 Tax=Temnothorax americanus TaxID=1964332 RepID=UPI004067F6C4
MYICTYVQRTTDHKINSGAKEILEYSYLHLHTADYKINSEAKGILEYQEKMEQKKIGAKRPYPSDQSIDLALATFFFSCNIPFNVVESKLFKNFVNLLNPNYKVPTRKKLSNQLLDAVHEEITTKPWKDQNTEGVLVIDGWKNSAANTHQVVCIIHTVMDKSIYLNSWDLTGVRETGAALSKVVEEATEMASNRFNIRIYAIVSDNASAMISMGKSVEHWHVTCASHSANLLAKSLIDREFAECVNRLLKEFKRPGPEKELVKGGGKKIVLACETRWCSHRDAFRNCLSNLSIMRELVKHRKVVVQTDISEILSSNEFEMRLQDYVLIFDPVCEIINKCQRSNSSIADACEEWFKLSIPTDNINYEKILQDRLEKALRPAILTANYLHPVYKGKRFMHLEKYRRQVYDFLGKELNIENPPDHPDVQAFINGTGIFKSLNNKNIKSPQTYWFIVGKTYSLLGGLAEKLMKIPASSAQIERVFSNWSFIHSDLRNRLTAERSQKLIEIYYSLKMTDEWDEYNFSKSD